MVDFRDRHRTGSSRFSISSSTCSASSVLLIDGMSSCGGDSSTVSCPSTSGDAPLPTTGFTPLDYVVLVAYLIGIAIAGIRLGGAVLPPAITFWQG